MGRFLLVDHPADIAVRIEAKDIPDIFTTALEAFNSIVLDAKYLEKSNEKNLELVGNSLDELLIIFLSELNYLVETKTFFVASVEKIEIENFNSRLKLNCNLLGMRDHQNLIKVKEEIKAVTFHQAGIKETNSGLSAFVVFDV